MADLNTPLVDLIGMGWDKAKEIGSGIANVGRNIVSSLDPIMSQPVGSSDNMLQPAPKAPVTAVPSPVVQTNTTTQQPGVSDLGIIPPSPFGVPSPTPSAAPVFSPQITAADVTPTQKDIGSTSESFSVASQRPSDDLVPTQASYNEYDPKTQENYVTKKTELDKASLAVSELMNVAKNDPGIKKIALQLAKNMGRVEDLLDPDSPSYKEFTGKLNEAKAKVDESRKDLEKFQADFKVDPDRYMKEMPALTLAINAIASIYDAKASAAAIRAGLTPSPQNTLTRIQKAIDQDIGLQKEEYLRGEASKKNTVNRYADNVKALGDERLAELKTRMDMNSVLPALMDMKIQAKYGADIDQKKFEALKAQQAATTAATEMELTKKVIGAQLLSGKASMSVSDMKSKQEMEENEASHYVRFGEDVIRADTKDAAKELKDELAASKNILTNMDMMEALYNHLNLSSKLPLAQRPTVAALKSAFGDYVANYIKEKKLGAFDAGLQEHVKTVMDAPDSKAFFSNLDGFKAQLSTNKEASLNKIKDSIFRNTGRKLDMDAMKKPLGLGTYTSLSSEELAKKFNL